MKMNWQKAFRRARVALSLLLLVTLTGCGSEKAQVFVQGDPKIALSSFDEKKLSFTVTINAPENSEKVTVAVWNAAVDDKKNSQDDLVWYDAEYAGGAWQAVVKLDRSHYSAGYYFVHIYRNDIFYSDAFLITPEVNQD